MRTVIKVENIGKQYRLGVFGTGTISHDLNRWFAKVRGKEDPFLKVGDVNDRTKTGGSDYVWALKDINFEIQQGEVLGIIGKNGAGKSTLLKILSQVTTPTTGSIKVKGRIASLLEVGTGFHMELTGRENIFLNGTILGMTKSEIKNKLDEIVEFSGCSKYLDTPVKRYSSGMIVRLGFAVAAHLDPEILVVDEVLAVGDAEFQKKCLGKMKDVSQQGRTVVFVSHNMSSIRSLCSKAILIDKGSIYTSGETNQVIGTYLKLNSIQNTNLNGEIPENVSSYNNGEAKFKRICIYNEDGNISDEIYFKEKIKFRINIEIYKNIEGVILNLLLINAYGETLMMAVDNENYHPRNFDQGIYEIDIDFFDTLMPDSYSVGLSLAYHNTGNAIDYIESFYNFIVAKEAKDGASEYPWHTIHGFMVPHTKWIYKKV